MKLIFKIMAGIILSIVVIVIAATALLSSAVNKATTKQGWTVRVTAPAGKHWSGAFGNHTVDGVGSKTVSFRDTSITAADAQKQTGGNWSLRLTLVKNGKVLDTESTKAQYGVVTVDGSNF
jgi:hypothetical protein